MAGALRSQSTLTYASRTNSVMTAPVGLANDDILVMQMAVGRGSGGPTAVTPPAGFTLWGTSTAVGPDAGGFRVTLHIWWKRAASESGSYTFTHAAQSTNCVLEAWSGLVTAGTPLGATSNNNGTAASTIGTGITTTAANSILKFVAHDWTGSGTLTPPTGMTGSLNQLLYCSYQTIATASATGNRTQTNANTGGAGEFWAARMVELLVASAGAYTLTADAGSYAITGTAATLARAAKLDATAGAYTITGTAAGLLYGHRLDAAGGSYAITGTDAGFARTYVLGASAGSYAITGTSANLLAARTLPALSGSYAITGTDASLLSARVLPALAGSYSITGTDVGLVKGYRFTADAGSYVITGTSATLVVQGAGNYILVANPGTYNITGTAAGFRRIYVLQAESGSYQITGGAATFVVTKPGTAPAFNGAGSPRQRSYFRPAKARLRSAPPPMPQAEPKVLKDASPERLEKADPGVVEEPKVVYTLPPRRVKLPLQKNPFIVQGQDPFEHATHVLHKIDMARLKQAIADEEAILMLMD